MIRVLSERGGEGGGILVLILRRDFIRGYILGDDGQRGIGPAEAEAGAEERVRGGYRIRVKERYDNSNNNSVVNVDGTDENDSQWEEGGE